MNILQRCSGLQCPWLRLAQVPKILQSGSLHARHYGPSCGLCLHSVGPRSTGKELRLERRCQASGSGHGELVLGIESSCDDTGVAVLCADSGRVLGEALVSQTDIHAPWGGVVPNLAMEAHKAAMDSAVTLALQQAGVSAADLHAVAVTQGPGLSMCLRVGMHKGRQLAARHKLRFVGVHHLEAHALMPRQAEDIAFPYLCLLVSGGHSLLLVVHGVGNYEQLGCSLDDAVGEAFDKAARMLNLDARPSGGAAIEALAMTGDAHRIPFPMPLAKRRDCNFSYAGLKTSVMRAISGAAFGESCDAQLQMKADIAASFQRVATEHLIDRCRRGAGWAMAASPEMSTLVVSGGVACNQRLRGSLQAMADEAGLRLVLPPPRLCTDNGPMVAWAGIERLRLGLWEPPPACEPAEDDIFDVRPRWPLTNRLDERSLPEKRTMKKKRLHTSLTELTQQQLGLPSKLDAPDRVLASASLG